MSSKPVWSHPIEEAAWREKWCRTCFQPEEALKRITNEGAGCPHLTRAASGKLPIPWTKRRNAPYGDTYRCDAYMKKPAVNRRAKADIEIEPMFELPPEAQDVHLIPIDGWPDYRAEARKQKEGDHQ